MFKKTLIELISAPDDYRVEIIGIEFRNKYDRMIHKRINCNLKDIVK